MNRREFVVKGTFAGLALNAGAPLLESAAQAAPGTTLVRNGKAQYIPYVNNKGETAEVASGYAVPFSFDVTAALAPGAENQITIETKRGALNELGSGGLLGPA